MEGSLVGQTEVVLVTRIVKSSSSLRGQASSLALIPAVGKQESQLKWINQYMYRYSVGRPSYLCTKQSN